MAARLLLLPSILVALFAVAPSPVRSELPEAPAPRAKKTTAELLIGTWKLVESSYVKLSPGFDKRYEYNSDGKFTVQTLDPNRGFKQTGGTFLVDGCNLRFSYNADADGPMRTWNAIIEEITEKDLTVAAGTGLARQWGKYKRG